MADAFGCPTADGIDDVGWAFYGTEAITQTVTEGVDWHGSCLLKSVRHFYDCSFLPRETQAHFGGPFFVRQSLRS